MAKIDLKKFRAEAERKFPGDRPQQDAWVAVMTSPPLPSTVKKRASTAKKMPAKKVVKSIAKRRRSF